MRPAPAQKAGRRWEIWESREDWGIFTKNPQAEGVDLPRYMFTGVGESLLGRIIPFSGSERKTGRMPAGACRVRCGGTIKPEQLLSDQIVWLSCARQEDPDNNADREPAIRSCS